MQRYASVIGMHESRVEEYRKLHAAVWPDVAKMIEKCHIHNYSIYLRKIAGRSYLFSYFEYTGDDFDADMERMAADPVTQEWWDQCKPCQVPLPDREDGEWWASMVEVFHQD